MVSEEVELIVESLLGVLLRTILEVSSRPQPAGPPLRLQVQDVTVRLPRARIPPTPMAVVRIPDPGQTHGGGGRGEEVAVTVAGAKGRAADVFCVPPS